MVLGKSGDAVFQKTDGDSLKQCFLSVVPHNIFGRFLDKSWNTYIEILKCGGEKLQIHLKISTEFLSGDWKSPCDKNCSFVS